MTPRTSAPVPRRPRRQPAATRRSCSQARERARRRAPRRRRAARRRGRRDPRRRAQAGGGRAAVGHRRRVPPRVVAHGLHLPARRHHARRGAHPGPVPQRGGDDRLRAGRDARRGPRRRCTEPIFADAFAFLQSMRDDGDAEAHDPLAEHGPLPRRAAAIDDDVYPDLDDFWNDLTAAYADEVRGPGRARLHLPAVRRHEPRLPQRPQAARASSPQLGGDAEHLHERYIRHINEALAGRPPEGMAITDPHVPRQLPSSWVAEGGYDFVAEALFNDLAVDGFFLEYDDARSGGFEPLRFVPPGKLVVLGLVTTKRGDAREQGRAQAPHRGGRPVRRRSTSSACRRQCGFSSTVEGNALTHDEQWAKLRAHRRDGARGLGVSTRAVDKLVA